MSRANEVRPYKDEADHVTGTATASGGVTGMRFVDISDDIQPNGTYGIALCGAGVRAFGVAGYDAVQGEALPVFREGILPVKAGDTITAGEEVESDNTGQAIPLDTGVASGKAVTGAASGDIARIAFYK